jgi:predicted RNA-binding protein (virulence factor B family)
MIKIGKTCTLPVVKIVDFGVYLDAQELGEILLPKRRCPDELDVGDEIEVFLYLDSEDRPVATTQKPRAEVEQFAYLKVVDITDIGAFLDWGLDKDLFVPFREQHRQMELGKSYIVYVHINPADGRIMASSKIERFLDDERPHDFQPRQPVDLIIANSTELGYKAIVNHSHWGVLYQDEVFQRLSYGQYKKGFIKKIRDDGKIDLTLQGGKETRDKNAKIILIYLQKQGGFAPVHDKSDPAMISRLFGMSKNAFKKTIGGLYKQRIISIEKDGIRLLEKQS